MVVSRSDLRATGPLIASLDEKGVNYTTADIQALKSAHYIDPDKTTRVVSRPGWRPSGHFAWPGRVISEGGEEARFEWSGGNRETGIGHRKGRVLDWRGAVGAAGAQSNFLLFGLGCAFAAPLLRFSAASEPAVFNMTGASGAGKTLLLLAVQSVVGRCRRDDLITWDLTRSGLEELRARVKDYLLVIDDTSRDRLDAKGRLRFFEDAGHMLSGGGKRRRGRGWEGQYGTSPGAAPVLSLSTGEVSMRDLATSVRSDIAGGARVRFIDVPVPLPAEGGIFDIAVNGLEGLDISVTAQAAARHLEASVAEHYGSAFPAFVTYLEGHYRYPKEVAKHVQQLENEFLQQVRRVRPGVAMGASEQRVAQKFALVYAGLMMAKRASLLSVNAENNLTAVMVCFDAATRMEAEARERIDAMVRRLRATLSDDRKVPRIKRGQPWPADTLGFRRDHDGQEVAYMANDQLSQAAEIKPDEAPELMAELDRLQALLPGQGARSRQVKVDGRELRMYLFRRSFWRGKSCPT